MQEQLKNYASKAKQGWKNLSQNVKKGIFIGLVVLLISGAILLIINLTAPYSTLFTGLSSDDMTSVVTYLSENGVTNYRIEGQDTILVPEAQVAQLKADLLMQGYPNSGFGFNTYLDNVGALTTESERETLLLHSLKDEMEAVIKCFDFVEDAQVLIVAAEDSTYVLDSSNSIDASASVMVTMTSGAMLTDGQVTAIRQLVSTAVKGLTIENITITDTQGNHYGSSGDSSVGNAQDATTLKLDLERQVNNTLRTNIIHILGPLFGEDNLRVSVNSVVDVSRSVTDSVNYTLEDWAADGSTDGKNIIGTRVYDQYVIRQPDTTAEGGAAGTTTNADINTYVEEGALSDGELEQLENYGEETFLVDTTSQQSENLGGTVSDIMVSITVNSEAAGGMTADELYGVVARAAGIDAQFQEEKINIMIAPFAGGEIVDPIINATELPEWILYPAIGLAAFLLLMIIILILVSRKNKKRRKKEEQAAAAAAGIAPSDNQAILNTLVGDDEPLDIMQMRTDMSVKLRRTVRDFANENPEIAAQMVKNWLKEGDDKNGR